MTQPQVIDVQRTRSENPSSKWEREHAAFMKMLPALLSGNRGKYVAVHEGAVVAISDDAISAAMQAYKKHGYIAIHVGLVTDQAPAPFRLPAPRLRQSARKA